MGNEGRINDKISRWRERSRRWLINPRLESKPGFPNGCLSPRWKERNSEETDRKREERERETVQGPPLPLAGAKIGINWYDLRFSRHLEIERRGKKECPGSRFAKKTKLVGGKRWERSISSPMNLAPQRTRQLSPRIAIRRRGNSWMSHDYCG